MNESATGLVLLMCFAVFTISCVIGAIVYVLCAKDGEPQDDIEQIKQRQRMKAISEPIYRSPI